SIFQPLTVDANRAPFIDDGEINISPGSSLNVVGDYTRGAKSISRFVLTQADASSARSPITVSGEADLDGEVVVSFAAGFIPSPTNKFTLLQCNTRSGVFGKATLPPPRPGYTWDLHYTTNSVQLALINASDAPLYEIEFIPPDNVRFTFSGPPAG